MKKSLIALTLTLLLLGCATAERDAVRVPDHTARAGEFYSFLILPCFHPPQEYIVMLRDGRFLIGKQGYDGAGGYPHHKNSSYEEVEITSEDWHAIRDRLLAAGFWDPSVSDCQDVVVLDGDSLRISAAKEKVRKEVFLRDAYCRKDLSHFTAIATKARDTFRARKEKRSANQPPLPTPGKCPPSNHQQLPGAADL
jgi:hypothetical protein